MLVLDVVDPVARSGELSQLIRVLRACLLMFSASPATAAMEICCVWWTTKEEALADAAPYTVRSVFWCPPLPFRTRGGGLLGGRRNATQSFHEHQPRYGFLDPLLTHFAS